MRDECCSTQLDSHTTTRYWFGPHVYSCRTPAGVVLLDIERGKYLALSNDVVESVADRIHNWPVGAHFVSGARRSSGPGAQRILSQLLSAKLLTSVPPDSEPRATLSVTLSTKLLAVGTEVRSFIPLRPGHVWNFLCACAWSLAVLRCQPLQRIVCRVKARKAKLASRPSDLELRRTAIELVGVFRCLRPYVFTAHGRCLFHALALVTFLSRYGVPASLVFGVSTLPWRAHSWAQLDDMVLDSSPEVVVELTPILIV
jgi:hypothetical protein